MKLFAVRSCAPANEPVGFFYVARDKLAIAVDAVMNPHECEFIEIKTETALLWEDVKVGWRMGVKEILDDPDGVEAELREQQVKEGMTFDGSLEANGSMGSFVRGEEDIEGWKPVMKPTKDVEKVYPKAKRQPPDSRPKPRLVK